MPKRKFGWKRRIAAAVVAIIAIHLLFKYVPLYIETRHRFYPEAWAEADAILRDFVGDAAVDRGIFSIPKSQIGVSHCGAAWVRLDDRPTLVITPEGCAIRHSGSGINEKLQFGAVSRQEAQHVMAVLNYTAAAEVAPSGGFDDVGEDRGFHLRDFYAGPGASEELSADSSAMSVTGVLRRGLAAAYLARPPSGFEGAVDEKRIAAAVAATLDLSMPPEDHFDGRVLRAAVAAAEAHPARALTGPLKRIERMREAAYNPWPKWLWDMGLMETARISRRNRGRLLPHAAGAVKICRSWPGPRREAQLAYLEKTVLTGGRPQAGLISRHPDEFTRMVSEHWRQLEASRIVRYLQYAIRWGDGGRAIAERAVASQDPLLRAHGHLTLFDISGDRAQLAACIEASRMPVQMLGPDAVNDRYHWRNFYCALNRRYAQNGALREIPAFFAECCAGLPAETKNRYIFFDGPSSPVLQMLPALARSGTDEGMAILREIVEIGDGFYRQSLPSNPFSARLPAPLTNNIFAGASDIEEALAAGGPAVREFMLDYLQDKEHGFDGCASRIFIKALALKGDAEALELFENWPGPPQGDRRADPFWSKFWDVGELAARAAIEIRVRRADDVPEFLLSLPPEDRIDAERVAVERLADENTANELQALLADDKYAPIRREILMALARRREIEANQRE